MFEKKVELVAYLQNPEKNWDAEDGASCGARGCFSEKSSNDIHEEEILKEDYAQRKEKIFEETAGRGHGAVLDQSAFTFSIDNLTRASTLFLCASQYAAHLQQSLRRATAERGFHLEDILKDTGAEEIMKKEFLLYEKMIAEKVPTEDARYILPLATKTSIQTTINARELLHLYSQTIGENSEEIPLEVKDTIQKMYDEAYKIAPRLMELRENNMEVLSWLPNAQLFSMENKTIGTFKEFRTPLDRGVAFLGGSYLKLKNPNIKEAILTRNEAELANLKHAHFTFLASMSLATYHQMIRQRTLDQSVEPIIEAVIRKQYKIPPLIQGTKFESDYTKINEEAISFVLDNKNMDYFPDSLMIIPHSLKINDLLHVNGWNTIGFIAKRTCKTAQWEIRQIAEEISTIIKEEYPELGKFAVPQGILYGRCPEKNPCGYCRLKIK